MPMKGKYKWSGYGDIYTANTFLTSFAQLLVAHPQTHAVQLRPSGTTFSHPMKRERWEHTSAMMPFEKKGDGLKKGKGDSVEEDLLHIEVIFNGAGSTTGRIGISATENAKSDSDQLHNFLHIKRTDLYSSAERSGIDEHQEELSCNLVENKCMIIAHPSHIHARWCAELQRIFSVVSVLLWPTFSESPTADHPWEKPGSCTTPRKRPFSSFHVCLFPFVPELHWDRELDGILGSQHHVTFLHHIVIQNNRPESIDDAGEVGKAIPTHEDYTPFAILMGKTKCGLSKDQSREGTVEAPYNRSTKAGGVYPCRVAAVLNANIPLGRDAGRSKTALLVLHSPGAQLYGVETCASEAQRETFAFMKSFVTRWVVPRVSLKAIGGIWDGAEGGAGGTQSDDDVCGLKETLGTSYYYLQCSRSNDNAGSDSSLMCPSLRVRSIVLILDLPPTLWSAMCKGEAAGLKAESGGEPCAALPIPESDKSCSLLDSVAAQLGTAIEQALLLLATKNVDIFTFREFLVVGKNVTEESQLGGSSQGDKNTPFASASSVATRSTRGKYPRAVLIRSIAESLSEIIARSPHVDFVCAAEHCLFSSPKGSLVEDVVSTENKKQDSTKSESCGPQFCPTSRENHVYGGHVRLRYSLTELRQAIESKLQNC